MILKSIKTLNLLKPTNRIFRFLILKSKFKGISQWVQLQPQFPKDQNLNQ